MSYSIRDTCVSCGMCQDVCPQEAISEGELQFEIKAEMCVECGACANACPTGSIEKP